MDAFAQQLVNGLTLGSLYALIAVGYTVVYGIVQLINFAHGEIFMIGAFGALSTWLIFFASRSGSCFFELVTPRCMTNRQSPYAPRRSWRHRRWARESGADNCRRRSAEAAPYRGRQHLKHQLISRPPNAFRATALLRSSQYTDTDKGEFRGGVRCCLGEAAPLFSVSRIGRFGPD